MPRNKKHMILPDRRSKTGTTRNEKKTKTKRSKKNSPAKKIKKISLIRSLSRSGLLASKKTADKLNWNVDSKKRISPETPQLSRPFRVKRQGQTQMVAFIRDSHCLFSYWEISAESVDASQGHFKHEFGNSFRVLRVFKIGLCGEKILIEEIRIPTDEMNRYIQLQDSGGSYILEVGQKSVSGRYFMFARSNKVTTAIGSLSPITDPKWEPPAGILEYFDEGVEETLESEKKVFSAPLSQGRGPSRRKFGRGRHAASNF